MGRNAVERERVWLRAKAINELIEWSGSLLEQLPGDRDLSADDRRMWEELLHLRPGALSWRRFSEEFAGWEPERVAGALWAEARRWSEPEAASEPGGWQDKVRAFLDYVELEPRRALWLVGADDVARELATAGLEVPRLRNHPQAASLRRYGVAILCRGPKGHKDFNPWTGPITRMERTYAGPKLLTSTSSNISGIAGFVYRERGQIREYVRRWRAA